MSRLGGRLPARAAERPGIQSGIQLGRLFMNEDTAWEPVDDSIRWSLEDSAWASVRDSANLDTRWSVRESTWWSVDNPVGNSVSDEVWGLTREATHE